MPTRTGNFPIGFRRGGGAWQRDTAQLAAFARESGFQTIDLHPLTPTDAKIVRDAGLDIRSADLIDFGNLATPDAGKRKELREANVAYIKEAAGLGAKVFFTIVGAEPGVKRADNYKAAVEAFAPLAEAAASVGTVIAVEGYPGGSPHCALLCTTPETTRAFLKDVGKGVALNYDPSHLIRLGVDHVRFLKEFAPHVAHVHGKDTELMPEAVYEYGLYQPAAFSANHGFGAQAWRYAIPGHGVARWVEIFRILKSVNFSGAVSVELEDENFNGTEEGEKAGLLHALNFLRSA